MEANMILLRHTSYILMVISTVSAGLWRHTSTCLKVTHNFVSSRQDASTIASGGTSASDDDHISRIISSLLSEEPDEEKRAGTEQELVKLATESPLRRSTIIRELLQSVERLNKSNGNNLVLGPEIYFWGSATRVFAQLKAREAIDVIIRCIACGNGYTGSFGEQPSMDALIQMGPMVVPALSRALSNEHHGYTKVQIVLCLGAIGGSQARLALQRALRSETDKDVVWNIRDELRTMTQDVRLRKKRSKLTLPQNSPPFDSE